MWNTFTTPKTDAGRHAHDQSANRSLFDYFMTGSRDTDMRHTIRVATGAEGINFKGQGLPRAAVDDINTLTIGAAEGSWRPRMKQQLNPRPFLTTPYLGPGVGEGAANDMPFEGYTREPRSIGTISDRTTFYPLAPLLDERTADFKDTRHFIEADAASGWVRGGALTQMGYQAALDPTRRSA
jgi:hypothetical protein